MPLSSKVTKVENIVPRWLQDDRIVTRLFYGPTTYKTKLGQVITSQNKEVHLDSP